MTETETENPKDQESIPQEILNALNETRNP